MSLKGHLCYRDHLSLSIFLSINSRLEASRLCCCLIFNASCLVPEVAALVRGCCKEMYIAQRKSELLAFPLPELIPPEEVCCGS